MLQRTRPKARIIKSLQRGTITIATSNDRNTAALSPAVDLTRSTVRYLGGSTSASDSTRESMSSIDITNLTGSTMAVVRGAASAASSHTVSWELTEHY